MRSKLRGATPVACVILIVAACSTSPGSSKPADPTRSVVVGAATMSPIPTSTPMATALAGPPAAALAVEGGDPVDGQLGTYVWGDAGSDSPWLHGAPITVGAREPLSVTLRPGQPIASWSARFVVATADGPDGARSLGEGTGEPRFAAPSPGSWTVEVNVVFADTAGSSSYFWELTVR